MMVGLLNDSEESWAKGGGHNDATGPSDAAIEAQIALRQQARANRDFAAADAIRDALAKDGVILLDGADGTSWERQS